MTEARFATEPADIVIGIIGAFIGDWLLPRLEGASRTAELPHG
ncbi:GlsB/YeaQ/YmgE family stress response membrane protein [Mesorhizobium carmichaelinearum]